MSDISADEYWMHHALKLASHAKEQREVPVGAVVVFNDKIIGEGWNQPITQHDPTAHAEIIALRDAAKKMNNYRLPNCHLFVTIEPCAMCAGALVHARLASLIFGANEPKAGAIVSTNNLLDNPSLNHRVAYRHGVLASACGSLVKEFFLMKRQ